MNLENGETLEEKIIGEKYAVIKNEIFKIERIEKEYANTVCAIVNQNYKQLRKANVFNTEEAAKEYLNRQKEQQLDRISRKKKYKYVLQDMETGEYLCKTSYYYQDSKLHYKTFSGKNNVDFFDNIEEAKEIIRLFHIIDPLNDEISIAQISLLEIDELSNGWESILVYDNTKSKWINPEREEFNQQEDVEVEYSPEVLEQDRIDYLSSFDNVNQLPTIDDIFTSSDSDFWYGDIDFVLKDGTRCTLSYGDYNCIQHSFSDQKNNSEGLYIYKVSDDLFICASCLTLLQSKPDILKQYDCFINEYMNETESLLFPKNWTDEGIYAWCSKKQQKDEEYNESRSLRELREDQYPNDDDEEEDYEFDQNE